MLTCKTHEKCIENAIVKAEAICKDKGLKFTKLRNDILNIIWDSHKPIKAYEIIEKLDKDDLSRPNQIKHNHTKPPIVYRTLDFLLKTGLVHKIESLSSYIGCEHPLAHDNCYFLICKKCSEVKECCNNDISSAIYKTSFNNNFIFDYSNLEVFGICNECKSREFKVKVNVKNG